MRSSSPIFSSVWYLAAIWWNAVDFPSGTTASPVIPGAGWDPSLSKRVVRWERIDPSHADPTEKSLSATKCCPFYVWNFPSAMCHFYCRKLERGCITEGKGGVKYARINPGGILERLWPCNQFRSDSCFNCGHTARDHFLQNWSKLGWAQKPIDTWLDQALKIGTKTLPTLGDDSLSRKKRNRKIQHHLSKAEKLKSSRSKNKHQQYAFHRLYVQDASTNDQSYSPQKRSRSSFDRKRKSPAETIHSVPMEWRRGPGGISYAIPELDFKERAKKPIALNFAWFIVLDTLDNLMSIEALENRWNNKARNR